jgi:D-alanyl-D-alanine carboxypeptidase
MNFKIEIRAAKTEDIEALFQLRNASILGTTAAAYSNSQLRQWAAVRREAPLRKRILNGCALLAEYHGKLIGCNGIDLDRGEMVGLFVDPAWMGRGVGRRLLTEVERLAARFGLLNLSVEAAVPSIGFYEACGYRPADQAVITADPRTGLDALSMSRDFPRRQTRYGRRIMALLEELGIPADYGRQHRMPLQPESPRLASIGADIYGRDQQLRPSAAWAWNALKAAALEDGIEIQAVSAFRSADYQAGILRRKLEKGQSVNQILRISAAPGYSEHHSGKALDVTTPGFEVLEEEFENSPAYAWLEANAGEFGFRMSFPRGNRHKVSFEPWHWAWAAG